MDNYSKYTPEKIKRLLKAYPEELLSQYVESRDILESKLPEEILTQWENIGLETVSYTHLTLPTNREV